MINYFSSLFCVVFSSAFLFAAQQEEVLRPGEQNGHEIAEVVQDPSETASDNSSESQARKKRVMEIDPFMDFIEKQEFKRYQNGKRSAFYSDEWMKPSEDGEERR